MSDRYVTGVVAALSLLAMACLAFIVPVPYVTMKPGPTFDTLATFGDKPMFTVQGAKTHRTSGHLRFTTVSVSDSQARITLADALVALVDRDAEVLPRELVYRKQTTSKQSRKESAAQLTSSKDDSRVAALRAAGFTVPEKVMVVAVTKDSPAEGKVAEGDQILQVDGTPVTGAAQVGDLVGSRTPGSAVTLTVVRAGSRRDLTLTTIKADDGRARVGVALRGAFALPVTITNNVDDTIGGSSAGTMFALAIYDLLTPGALTGGLDIAGTGEISPDGTVMPIGGVRQKIAGAAHDGADIFLVPAANCADALDGYDTGLRLVRIETLAGAIDAIEALAKNPRAEVPTCRLG